MSHNENSPCETERDNLVALFKLATSEVIKAYDTDHEERKDDEFFPLRQFLTILEHIFLFALKDDGRDFCNLLERIQDCSLDVAELSPKVNERKRIKTQMGKTRARLSLAMMQKKLADYVSVLIDQKEMLSVSEDMNLYHEQLEEQSKQPADAVTEQKKQETFQREYETLQQQIKDLQAENNLYKKENEGLQAELDMIQQEDGIQSGHSCNGADQPIKHAVSIERNSETKFVAGGSWKMMEGHFDEAKNNSLLMPPKPAQPVLNESTDSSSDDESLDLGRLACLKDWNLLNDAPPEPQAANALFPMACPSPQSIGKELSRWMRGKPAVQEGDTLFKHSTDVLVGAVPASVEAVSAGDTTAGEVCIGETSKHFTLRPANDIYTQRPVTAEESTQTAAPKVDVYTQTPTQAVVNGHASVQTETQVVASISTQTEPPTTSNASPQTETQAPDDVTPPAEEPFSHPSTSTGPPKSAQLVLNESTNNYYNDEPLDLSHLASMQDWSLLNNEPPEPETAAPLFPMARPSPLTISKRFSHWMRSQPAVQSGVPTQIPVQAKASVHLVQKADVTTQTVAQAGASTQLSAHVFLQEVTQVAAEVSSQTETQTTNEVSTYAKVKANAKPADKTSNDVIPPGEEPLSHPSASVSELLSEPRPASVPAESSVAELKLKETVLLNDPSKYNKTESINQNFTESSLRHALAERAIPAGSNSGPQSTADARTQLVSLLSTIENQSSDVNADNKIQKEISLFKESRSMESEVFHSLPDSEDFDSISSESSVTPVQSCANEEGSETKDDVIMEIAGYVEREWKGATSKAGQIRQGYASVMDEHQFKNIARIRGDNYCALRATFASVVLNNVKLNLPLEQTLQGLESMTEADPSLLRSWRFPECLSDITADKSYDELYECLLFTISKMSILHCMEDSTEKRKELCKLLNTGGSEELYVLEGMKVLMMISAFELHKLYTAGQEVPVFTWLMFARDTSETPELFLKNHLNSVGRDSGVEQVEMCLLGYSLGITLQTFLLYQHGEVDFIAL